MTMNTSAATLPAGRILFVDDEPAVLQGVERSLRSTRSAWQCEFVDHPAAALDLMQHTTFHVVVSDMMMPGMDGAEFLARAGRVSPETVRLMLTGNADLKTAMAAVNQGHIFQFLLKPCESDQLIQSVTAALLQHRLQLAERELLREQLAHSDKMVTVGKLAAGITHDLNNILSAILIQSELELHEDPQKTVINPAFTLIHEAATSAVTLTRELNGFSRSPRIGDASTVALPELIEATLRITRPLLKHKIKIYTELASDLPLLQGNAGKFKQALMNLLLNARDAMPNGGAITIAAQACRFTAADHAVHPQCREGEFVCLSVRDTGAGMSPLIQQQIFQPFFTTKEGDKGMGLGLFMVQRVVREHHGWVELESAPGTGTTFRLYLPALTNLEPQARS